MPYIFYFKNTQCVFFINKNLHLHYTISIHYFCQVIKKITVINAYRKISEFTVIIIRIDHTDLYILIKLTKLLKPVEPLSLAKFIEIKVGSSQFVCVSFVAVLPVKSLNNVCSHAGFFRN